MQEKITPPRRYMRTQSVGSAGGLVFVLSVFVVLFGLGGAAVQFGFPPTTAQLQQQTGSETTTRPAGQDGEEILNRLREILKVRDEAYQQRRASLLDSIYTPDCPCRAADTLAIQQLLRDRQLQVGGVTEVVDPVAQRVSERQWVVTAVLRTSQLQVRSESGQVLRTEPPDANRWRFALVLPPRGHAWLLGGAWLLQEGG